MFCFQQSLLQIPLRFRHLSKLKWFLYLRLPKNIICHFAPTLKFNLFWVWDITTFFLLIWYKCTLAVTGQYFRQSKSRPDLAVEKDKDLQISLTPKGHLDIELPFLKDDEDIIWWWGLSEYHIYFLRKKTPTNIIIFSNMKLNKFT